MEITTNDILLAKQPFQRRYIMIKVLNRDFFVQYLLKGQVLSATINIDASSNIRRTFSLNTILEDINLNQLINFNSNNYLDIYLGIEDSNTQQTTWYKQGIFIVHENSFEYSKSSRQLSMTCSDLMYDFTAEGKGVLYGYSPIIKSGENIQYVIVSMVTNYGGIKKYSVETVGVNSEYDYTQSSDESDYTVPYDINLSTGFTIYDVLEKMVTLYPNWEMFFTADGQFVVKRMLLDQDASSPLIDANMFRGLVIDEKRNFNYNDMVNIIEVWGKDGLFYGEAKDETASSPFNIKLYGEKRKVFSGSEYDNIQNLYADTNMTVVKVSGDDQAKEWSEFLLYKYCRLNDSISLTLVGCPFINEVNFKVTYRSKVDNKIYTYIVKKVSHDFNKDNATTTLEMVRFYNENVVEFRPKLIAPVITNYSVNNMSVSFEVNPVDYASGYILYMDFKKVMETTSTTLSYTFDLQYQGIHAFSVVAYGNNVQSSDYSEPVQVELNAYSNALITDDKSILITDDGYYLAYTD